MIKIWLNNLTTQPVSAHFWRAFGKLLPPNVNFYMRNGSRYEGTCAKKERKMYGLQDLIRDYGLTETEKILFTYFGEGNFSVLIFDISNVEAMLVAVDLDSSGKTLI